MSSEKNENDKETDDYEIGYGKPPKQSRFKKGQSGNPKGRPRGVRDFDKLMEAMLNGKVTVTESGKTRKISRLEATMMQLVTKAMKGDPKAIAQVLPEARRVSVSLNANDEERVLAASEKDILERYEQEIVARFLKSGGASEGAEPGSPSDKEDDSDAE